MMFSLYSLSARISSSWRRSLPYSREFSMASATGAVSVLDEVQVVARERLFAALRAEEEESLQLAAVAQREDIAIAGARAAATAPRWRPAGAAR